MKVKLHLRLLVYFYKVFKYHTPCIFFERLVYEGLRHGYKTCQVSKDQLSLTNLMKKITLSRICCLEYGFHKYKRVTVHMYLEEKLRYAYKYVDVYFKCCFC